MKREEKRMTQKALYSKSLHSSIQTKMILTLVLTATVILAGYALSDYLLTSARMKKEFANFAEYVVNQQSKSLALPLWYLDKEAIEGVINSAMTDKQLYAIRIREETGIVYGKIRDDNWNIVEISNIFSGDYYARSKDIFHNNQKLGVVEVFLTPRFMQAKLGRATAGMLIAIIVLNISLISMLFISIRKSIIIPISLVAEGVRFIASGNLDRSIRSKRMDEIGELSSNVEAMRLAIKENFDLVQEKNRMLNIEISERKSAEEALRESEAKFRGLVESSSDWIWEIDAEGVYTYASPQIETILGYRSVEVVGKKPFDLMPPEEAARISAIFKDKIKNGKSIVALENVYLDKEGRRIVLEKSGIPVLDETGKIAGYLGMDRDITLRKITEDALRESEEKYRTLVEKSPLGIAVINEQQNYTYLSSNFIKIFGYTLSDFSTGREWFDLAYPDKDYQRYVIKKWIDEENSSAANELKPRIFDVVCKDGTIKTIDFKIAALETGAKLLIYEDITERKKSEVLMIQTEKMMSVGGLAAGMAHELNNPLGGMLQGVQNIQRRLSPDLKSNLGPSKEFGIDLHNLQLYLEERKILSFLDGIKESGKKASQIISNMLQFSRKSESQMAPTDLAILIENVLELAGKDYDLKKKYDFRNIKLKKEFDSDLPLVLCTETEIEQVVLNLFRNAAQAMIGEKQKDSNQIIIRIRLLHDEKKVKIEVEDNGPGMDESISKRVFEPFFTTKPEGQGTGLGLSVSYMIITNNHKGTMEVESEVGKGTRFIIRLPLERESS